MLRIRAMALVALLVGVLASLVATISSAQAATLRNGVCETGEFCYYYNSDFAGSVSDHGAQLADYGSTTPSCYTFRTAGKAGYGKCVKNNAASVFNRTSKTIRVYYNSNFGGKYVDIAAGTRRNLAGTGLYNQNASHGPKPSTSTVRISYGIYRATGGYITAGFDGYVNTPGRHEGIDIRKEISSPVKALIPGKVVRLTRGYTGSSGLSQIAVYNATLNKTVVYLHTKPLDSLAVGQTVSRGQQIAVESWRGISSSSGHHTHVEMRLGYQTSAAKSVNDYHLDNPNPTTFWASQGYDSLH